MRATFQLENLKGRDHFKDLGVDGKILEWNLMEIGWDGVYIVTNLRVPYKEGIS
jgi:hypothetical protein